MDTRFGFDSEAGKFVQLIVKVAHNCFVLAEFAGDLQLFPR